MAISDYSGLIVLGLIIAFIGFMIYKDAKSTKPIGNFQNIHTLTQGVNLLDSNVERDNQALSSATKHNIDDLSLKDD